MALPWLTLIKSVPWTEVIAHAPSVVTSAKKLWHGTRASGGAPGVAHRDTTTPGSPAVSSTALRLAELESQVAELQASLAQTNTLLTDMAEQQARLVAQVEAHRRKLQRVGVLAGVACVVALGLMAYLVA